MPGQPIRARARFQFPPAIHPRELPAATGVTAIIIRQALRFPRFAAPTVIHNVPARNRKTFPPCAETVDDGTSLWKPEENRVSFNPVGRDLFRAALDVLDVTGHRVRIEIAPQQLPCFSVLLILRMAVLCMQ